MGTPMPAGPGERRRSACWVLAVLGLALLPSIGTLRAPWIAEDAAILARVARDGPWADWTRSQYGLELWRFWRPVVSTSWALQEAWTGIDPLALRLFNLALHAGTALLAFACARRLGLPARAAFLAGAWVALFPEQGGTVTWIAGRTDLLAASLLLATSWVALGSAPLASAPLAFLACASKEFGFLAPLWIALLAAARGESWRAALRRSTPAFVAVGVALLWRRAALGTFVGGYAFSAPPAGGGVIAALGVTLSSTPAAWLPLVILAGAGLSVGCASLRGLACAALCAVLGVVPLLPLLADGHFEPQNLRLFFVADCGFALAAGFVLHHSVASARRAAVPLLLALLALGLRLVLAFGDTHDWARSARLGEEEVARARSALAGDAPGSAPVFLAGFDLSAFDAYCLGFGLPDRFRAPFPATPRPLWPWRLAFPGGSGRERDSGVPARADGSMRPLEESGAPTLALVLDGDETGGGLVLDDRAFRSSEDRSPRIELRGGPPGAAVEALVVTEIGYGPVPCGALDAQGGGALSLMQFLACTDGVASSADVLALAADLGATRAFLVFRALGADGSVVVSSRWVEITWSRELLRRSLTPALPKKK